MQLSISKVESFLYYLRSDFKDLSELKADLLGTGERTEAMDRGIAFHSIMEDAKAGQELTQVQRDGFVFEFAGDLVAPVGGLVELSTSTTYDVAGHPVVVRGRCDLYAGRKVIDYKLAKKFDDSVYAQYSRAFQWRAYLDLFDSEEFEYSLFLWRPARGKVLVHDVFPIRFRRYDGMRDDIVRMLADFMAFTRQHVPEFWEQQRERGYIN